MLKVLKFFYSIWTVVSFMLLTIPMAIGYLLLKLVPYTKQIHGVYIINRIAIFLWSVVVGMRYKIKGLENIDKEQTYVVVVNHVNAADMMATAYGQRVPAKPLVKRELTLIPGLGQLFSLMCLPVDRSSKEARHASKVRMLSELKQGISVLIFPEGTRNRTKNPLIPFFDGAFELAIDAQVPVLPVVLSNIRHINKVDTLLVQPGTMEITHLPPVNTKGMLPEQLEALKQTVYSKMESFLLENDSYFRKANVDI
ncbi:MAG TPA: lysophospholipid acyltransferase family protein [Chitinophagales bacterium]|nr:lysophospholipid acyltransferase family protein [Chitinophagales bacterium]